MKKIKVFFQKNGLLLNWKEFEKLDEAQKINTLANGGMSKPGMGDVLTGMIGSLASNYSINIEDAAIIGTYVHSQSGLLAKEKYGSTSMTASNVISFIPQVFKILE